MFFMLLGAPVPFWYELQTSDGEVYAKMPVLKTCRDACCSLCTKRTYRMRAAAKGTERVNVRSRRAGAVMARRATPSRRQARERPRTDSLRRRTCPSFTSSSQTRRRWQGALSSSRPSRRRHRLRKPTTSLPTTSSDLTDRNYKKMSGPTKTCSVKAPAASRPAKVGAPPAIEKFFFAKDVVDQFG